MDPSELLNRLSHTLEELHIPYLVTGSMATIAYGEPRFTNDIRGVLAVMGDEIDYSYINQWAKKLGLTREWSIVIKR